MTTPRLPNESIDSQMYYARSIESIDTDHAKLRDEFLSWPALCLTVAQVARLLSVSLMTASRLLAGLEGDGFLIRTSSGRYHLARPQYDERQYDALQQRPDARTRRSEGVAT
jgi:predicted transcriptional regulator of viral defense system